MNIGEARKAYYGQYQKFNTAAYEVAKEKEELEKKSKLYPGDAEGFSKEAARLELTHTALQEQAEAYMKDLEKIWDLESLYANAKSTEQQGEAMEAYYKDLGKIMTVARRLVNGDIVPASDEKKLMEYDNKLYMACKNAQALAQNRKKKEYDTLWGDEEELDMEDPLEYADSQEMPELGGDLSLEVSEVIPEGE